ncbi:MAG: hypothetical protein PVF75_09770, partial [Granulosicoccaceae bacterium]
IEKLVDQHIREYESRRKHIDELLERASKGEAAKAPEISAELADIMTKRDKLASQFEELRLKSLADWQEEGIERAGPMGIWDALAQQLEKLLERLER